MSELSVNNTGLYGLYEVHHKISEPQGSFDSLSLNVLQKDAKLSSTDRIRVLTIDFVTFQEL